MAMTIVTPMIWLKTRLLLCHAGQGVDGARDGERRGGAAGGPVDLRGQGLAGRRRPPRTTSACTTSSPTCSPGRLSPSTCAPRVQRAPQRALPRVAAVVEEADDLGHLGAGRAEPDGIALVDALGPQRLVGVAPRRAPGGRRAGPSAPARSRTPRPGRGPGRRGRRAGRRAARCRGRRPRPRPPTSSTSARDVGRRCGCARATRRRCAEYTTRSARWARRRPVLPAVSPSSSPPRNMSSRAIRLRMTVATAKRPGRRRSSAQRQPHRTPPPVVASIGSMASTCRAATSALATPERQQQAPHQNATAATSKRSASEPTSTRVQRRVERGADDEPAADHDHHLHEQRPHEHRRPAHPSPGAASARAPSGT